MSHEDQPRAARPPDVLIRRVRLRNFRSIAYCDVELKPLTVLVGRNGSGKSGFLDALAFLRDAVSSTFDQAVGERGGFDSLCFLGAAEPRTILVETGLQLADGRELVYGLEIGNPKDQGYYRKREWLQRGREGTCLFSIEDDRISNHQGVGGDLPLQAINQQRPYLVGPAAFSEAYIVSELLGGIFIYDLNHQNMRQLTPSGTSDNVLFRDGSNIAVVLDRIQKERPDVARERIRAYLQYIAPQIEDVRSQQAGSRYQTLSFKQTISGKQWELSPPLLVSDGTLRAVGCLVAVAQEARWGPPVRVIAIEEPENTIHPAALAGLMAAFDEATVEKQVILTTHSPALLDRIDLDSHQLLAVEAGPAGTRISPINAASREAIEEHLYTPGELLRMDQLQTDWRDLERQKSALEAPASAEA